MNDVYRKIVEYASLNLQIKELETMAGTKKLKRLALSDEITMELNLENAPPRAFNIDGTTYTVVKPVMGMLNVTVISIEHINRGQ